MSEPAVEPAVPPEPVEPVEPAEPVEPVEPAEPPEPAPAAQAIDWDDPAVQERIAGLSQQQTVALLEQLGLVSYAQPKTEGPPAPDPYSDNYAQELEAWYAAKREQDLAPFNEFVQSRQAAETNAVIDGEIGAALAAAKLEGVDAGLLRSVAAQFATQPEYAKYGATIEGVKATAKAAADWIVSERKTAGEAAVEAYKESLKNPVPGSTPYEPGIRGAGVLTEGQAQSELDVARNFRSRIPA